MKIKTDSWHYQLLENAGLIPKNRKNLCSYMRGLLMALLIPPMVVVSPLVLYWSFSFPEIDKVPVILSAIYLLITIWGFFGTIMVMGILLVVIIALVYKLGDKLYESIPLTISNIHWPKNNIVIEYIKAKKQKICPIVEFE